MQAPKTEGSRRLIDGVENSTVLALQSLKDQRGEEAKGDALVFSTSEGHPLDARNLLRDFHATIKRAGLPRVRFHDLRHTGASIALAYGVPVRDVSARLGHSSPRMTLDVYWH